MNYKTVIRFTSYGFGITKAQNTEQVQQEWTI